VYMTITTTMTQKIRLSKKSAMLSLTLIFSIRA
jgi:hypothetical protein